jgi:hypothetical protein
MDQKLVTTIVFGALLSLIGWNINTTNELQISVARMEMLIRSDAMEK